MKQRVLIPTDFTIESLTLLKRAAHASTVPIEVIFLHCFRLPNSIFDMLFYSPTKEVAKRSNEDFEEGTRIIVSRYASIILSTRVALFHGKNQGAFNQFLEGNRIDKIMVPSGYTWQFSKPDAFDPLPFMTNCGVPCEEVFWTSRDHVPDRNQLAELFHLL